MSLHDRVFDIVQFTYLKGHKYSVHEILSGINIDFQKKRLVFKISFHARKLIMSDFPVTLHKATVFVSICNIEDIVKFIKENEIAELQLLDFKVKCTRKLFNHWDYPSIKIYKYCKCFDVPKEMYFVSWLDKHSYNNL